MCPINEHDNLHFRNELDVHMCFKIYEGNCYLRNLGLITTFVNLGLFRHFETVTNIRTWIKPHIYWRML